VESKINKRQIKVIVVYFVLDGNNDE